MPSQMTFSDIHCSSNKNIRPRVMFKHFWDLKLDRVLGWWFLSLFDLGLPLKAWSLPTLRPRQALKDEAKLLLRFAPEEVVKIDGIVFRFGEIWGETQQGIFQNEVNLPMDEYG